jgi:hypothetical protein
MRKFIAALVLVCVVAGGVFGQTMLNTRIYLSYFSLRVNDIADSDYVWEASDDDILDFGSLNWNGKKNDDTGLVDTPLEFALLSYYSQPVLKIRPKEADAILPANNPKLADQKLGAAVFQEIQILRFLGNTEAVNRHEAVLQFITDRKNVTRAEIETYYRNNIRGLVSQVVDEQFARLKNEGRRVNPSANALRDVKNAITDFMIAPSEATYRNLLLTYHRGDWDGSGLILGYAMGQINVEISSALADNKILTGAGK